MLVLFTSEDVSSQLDIRHFVRSLSLSLILVRGVAQFALQRRIDQALGMS